jgi:hypothetical protein
VGKQQGEEYKRLSEIWEKKFGWFDWYDSNYPELSVFVKVTPILIESYVSKDDTSAREYLDLHSKRAYTTTQWDKQEY